MSTIKGIFDRTARAIGTAAQDTKAAVTDKLASGAQLGRDVAFGVESKALAARDSVMDTKDELVGAATRIINGALGTAFVMAEVGVVVAAFTAPVPTAIGVALLWLLESQLKGGSEPTDENVRSSLQSRRFRRLTNLLKKYGQIPETAILETGLVKLYVSSTTGEVSGSVLAGEFKDRELDSLSVDDIARLAAYAPDEDTKRILEAYASLRLEKLRVARDDTAPSDA